MQKGEPTYAGHKHNSPFGGTFLLPLAQLLLLLLLLLPSDFLLLQRRTVVHRSKRMLVVSRLLAPCLTMHATDVDE